MAKSRPGDYSPREGGAPAKVLAALQDGPMTVAALSQAIGQDVQKTRTTLYRIEDAGSIIRVQDEHLQVHYALEDVNIPEGFKPYTRAGTPIINAHAANMNPSDPFGLLAQKGADAAQSSSGASVDTGGKVVKVPRSPALAKPRKQKNVQPEERLTPDTFWAAFNVDGSLYIRNAGGSVELDASEISRLQQFMGRLAGVLHA